MNIFQLSDIREGYAVFPQPKQARSPKQSKQHASVSMWLIL